jgi:hypothetical protein
VSSFVLLFAALVCVEVVNSNGLGVTLVGTGS